MDEYERNIAKSIQERLSSMLPVGPDCAGALSRSPCPMMQLIKDALAECDNLLEETSADDNRTEELARIGHGAVSRWMRDNDFFMMGTKGRPNPITTPYDQLDEVGKEYFRVMARAISFELNGSGETGG
jgi:hypothetical protein